MTSRSVKAHFQCDCATCVKGDKRSELVMDMEGMSWNWVYTAARKVGWVLSPNGKYCFAPGHEKDLVRGTRTHKHH